MPKNIARKKNHRWLIIIGALLGVVIFLVALVPTILSSQWGKERALGLAAPLIPGEIGLDDWSLSWFGEQKLSGIRYAQKQAGLQIDAAEITVAKGLAGFLADRGNVGTLTVSRPEIQITLPEPPREGAEPVQTSRSGKTPADTAGQAEPSSGPAPVKPAGGIPPVSGRLVVEQGIIAVARTGEAASEVATDINMEIDIVSAIEPITYSLAMNSGDGTGSVSGAGKVQLDAADLSSASIKSAGELLISSWDISRLLDLASAFATLPSGGGILDGKINFSGDLSEGINLDGTVNLTNLQLTGGPLSDDSLSLDKTSLEFAALRRTDSFRLSSLKLASPLASGSLAAEISAGGAMQFSSDLRVDLPKVAGQLPHTLGLQEGLKITGGMLNIQAEAERKDGENRFSTNAVVEGLAGIRDKKQISLAEPFSFKLTGSQGKGGLSLENFVVQSSFLNGKGSGDLNDLKLSLDADLDAALKEISKFISLRNYQAGGRLDLNLEAKRMDEKTVGLTARLGVDKLVVKQGKTLLVPQNPLKLQADAALLLSPDFAFSGVKEAKLTYQTWFGDGSLEGREILLDADRKLKHIADLVAGGDLKFQELGVLLQSLGALPWEFAIDGESRFDFKLSGKDDRFLIDHLALEAPKLSLKKGSAQLIPAGPLKLKANGEIRLGPDGSVASVSQPNLNYECWLGSGHVKASAFDVTAMHLTALTFDGKTDFTKLAALLKILDILPPDLSFGGAGSTTLAMDYSPEQIDLASLRAEIDNFIFKQQEKTYQDKRLVIDAAGTVNVVKRQATFSPIHIKSANGAVSFEQLAVGDWKTPLDTLDSVGQAQFELATILTAAADWFSLPPDISAAAKIDLNWNGDTHSSSEQRYRLNADLSNFSLARAEIQAFSDEQVAVRMNGVRNPTTRHLAMEQFAVSSQPVSFDAAGSWNTAADDSSELAFKGNLAIDLARIAALTKTFTELDLEMAGKSENPFELAIALSPDQREAWWQRTNFSTAFKADFIKVLGVELRSLEIPVKVADGLAQAEVRGSANQGTLLLQPQLDLMSNPPLLTLPDNSRVLDKMQITQEMANKLLARIHPLFMGATQMSGVFDLDLQYFSWPLGKQNMNDLLFAGTMDFHDMRINSSTMIGALLKALRVEGEGLDLSGQQIQFACKDGRVVTNPLRTNLSDSELIISGSLGLDTTVDYLAQVAVTERLVGGDLYNYLEGTVINVPIGGTLAKPDISAKTVERAIADLASQAGQKKLQEAAGNLLKGLFK